MTTMFDTHRAFEDFERAYQKARWRTWFRRLTGRQNRLLSFEDIPQDLRHNNGHQLGLQSVPVDKIVGSEGRHREFDGAFYPRQRITKDRWVSIDRAHYAAVTLPPVELIRIGEEYFVRDGNHRVSVARAKGQVFIDANVIQIAKTRRSGTANSHQVRAERS
jgi:hypothetical protein